jgi:phosphoglycolate phosphatase
MARLLAAYLERLPQEVETSEQYRVLPGAEALLRRLWREGYLVGIVTGALEAAAHIKLARARLNRFFAFGGYGSDSPNRTDLTRRAMERAGAIMGLELDPASVYVVGDTPKDMEAARGVGAVAVGIASGHYSTNDLLHAGAHVVQPSLEDPIPGLEAR